MVFIYTRNRSRCRSCHNKTGNVNNNNINAAAFVSVARLGSLFVFLLLLFTTVLYITHRLISIQQNNRILVRAPIHRIERQCPKPTYPTLGGDIWAGNNNNNNNNRDPNNICLTTLTDERRADVWQRLVRWRSFDHLLPRTWANKLNYCMKHQYQLFDESITSLDTSRAPAWSKIPAVKRLLLEEDCDWVFWLDADTVIMNSTVRIEDFLPTDNSTVDLVVTHQKGNSWNAGAWLLRNTDWSLKFLDDWWNMSQYSLAKGQADAGDNEAMKVLLTNLKDYDKKVVTPPRCQFNSVAKFWTPTEAIRMTPQSLHDSGMLLDEQLYHKGDFIAHIAGINNKIATTDMLLADAQ